MSDKRLFGTILRFLRLGRGVSQEELGQRIGYSRSLIDTWENGESIPSPETIEKIIDVLALSADEARSLQEQAGYSPSQETRPVRSSIFSRAVEAGNSLLLVKRDPVRELDIRFLDIQNAVEDLSTQVEKMWTGEPSDHPSVLAGEIERLKENLAQLQATHQEITAPVTLPSREDMAVTLVSSTSLEHLEEYRSETNRWSSWASLLIGSIIGIAVNVATGGEMKREAWVMVAAFALLAGLTGWSAARYHLRGNKLRDSLLGKRSS